MIEVTNLTITYKDLVAVDSISFDVKKGEIFGIIGPNGAGKTSAIECLEGLRKLSGGQRQKIFIVCTAVSIKVFRWE